VKAIQLKAAGELATRMTGTAGLKKKHKITSPGDVQAIYLDRLRYVNKEKFIVLALNTRNEIIREIEVSVGSLSETIVHPREVFGEVVKEPAAAVILMHNHPSGDPSPSENDKKTTARLEEAGKILGIRILDHVIIGNRSIFSFKENGLM
jgi:DNA repair protein RadC